VAKMVKQAGQYSQCISVVFDDQNSQTLPRSERLRC
jgi:hypothetical protein